jgi:hypothetical protein
MSNSFENSTLGNVLRSFLGLGSSASLEAVEFSRNLSGVLARNRAQGFVSLSTLYRDPLSGRQTVQSAYLEDHKLEERFPNLPESWFYDSPAWEVAEKLSGFLESADHF